MPYPTKLTPELLEELVAIVRGGVPVRTALQAKGVHSSRAWSWFRNGQERPGSIYGAFREQIIRATAEADTIDLQIITNAKTRGATRKTTVVKHEARVTPAGTVMEETERIVTTVELPPDANLALKMLERRNPAFRATQQIDASVTAVPREIMARTLAERLRMIQGGEGPSMLLEGDDEARRIMGA